MTDTTSNFSPELPISFALATTLDNQIAAVQGNPIGSQTRSLGQNIDAIFATLQATVAAIQALEAELHASK